MKEINGQILPSHWIIYERYMDHPDLLPTFGIIGFAEFAGLHTVIVYQDGNLLAMSIERYDILASSVHGAISATTH